MHKDFNDFVVLNDHMMYHLHRHGAGYGEIALFGKVYSICGNGTSMGELSNGYLCQFFDASESTITRWVQFLVKMGVIEVTIQRTRVGGAVRTKRLFNITQKGNDIVNGCYATNMS